MLECCLEPVERVDLLHFGGEGSISYQVAQLLVELLNLCAWCVAHPIAEPESVKAETKVDEVLRREGRDLPTVDGVDDNRAAPLERLAQLAHGASAECVKDQAKFFPMKGLLDILGQVVALEDDAVTPQTPYLLCGLFSTDDIQCFDSRELCDLDDVLSHCRVGCSLTDPVAGHQRGIPVQ